MDTTIRKWMSLLTLDVMKRWFALHSLHAMGVYTQCRLQDVGWCSSTDGIKSVPAPLVHTERVHWEQDNAVLGLSVLGAR